MRASHILILSMLFGSCAATPRLASPAPEGLPTLEPVDAPSIEPPVAEVPEPEPRGSLDAATVPVASELFGGAFSTSAQAQAQTPAAQPESRHGFGVGAGIRVRGGDSAFDLMTQYKYFVNPHLDIGGIADWAFSPIDSFVIAPAVWWNVGQRLALLGAPGVEFVSGNGKGLVRLGASYQFKLGKAALLPYAWYDFVTDRKDAFTFGVAIEF